MVNGFWVMSGLIFILIILIMMKWGSKRKPKQMVVYDYETFQPDTPEITYQSYVNQLEWMFQMGIISVQEYNQYHQDGLQFINMNGVESN